ncbi:hypothetical protein GCM10009539_26690 [Cryptosporangium japonicum]|uniref:GGDEF domain-containing protein n=1 Tax=Cryptosporangium japonicum TaxID=80872 RepID=A0ABP3DUH8_9ACTN
MREPWIGFLVGGLVLVVAYRVAPALGVPDLVRTGVYWLLNSAAVVAILVGIRRYRPASRAPWVLAALSQASGVIADIVFYGADAIGEPLPYPSVADALYLLSYPLCAAGMLMIIRRRTPGWDLPSVIDAAIVVASASLLAWIYLISPSASGSGLGLPARIVSGAYPIGDLMLLVVAARLLLGAGKRPFALHLLTGYLVLIVVPDTLYCLQTLDGSYREGGWLETLWMGAAVLLGLSGLHPSMRAADGRSPVAAPDATAVRLTILAVASLLAPATLMVQYLTGSALHLPLACAVCALLFLLVMARLAALVAVQRNVAITDGLTGLRTRRYFSQVLATESDRISRGTGPAVLLLDVDHFKKVNDTYGHHGGDRVLCEVSDRLRRAVRPGDLVARYGGEEFAVILPNTTPAEAHRVAQRVHRAVRGAPMVVNPTTAVPVTVSLGVATMPGDAHTPDELVQLADRLLYLAKETGRDQVATSKAITVTAAEAELSLV